jgi:DNA replication licensing factor MCM2
LTDPILQRFDCLCVLQDVVDPVADERLAQFVTSSHMRSVPTREYVPNESDLADNNAERPGLIRQDLLRKYIQYARSNVRPILRGNALDQEKVSSLYVALRRESAASGGVPIAVRHVESIMRMSEAHAKMHLRDYVRDDDMDASIRMMLESFIMAQKFSVQRALRRSFAKFITSGEDRAYLLLHILQDMFRKEQMYQVIRLRQRNQTEDDLETLDVPLDELEARARERRIYDVSEFCRSEAFTEAGYVLDERRRVVSRNLVV